MHNLKLVLGCLLFACNLTWAEATLFKNAHILTAGTPAEYEQGEILVVDGEIAAVGQTVDLPTGAKVVDLQSATVTPGLVLADTDLGTVEISMSANANDSSSGAATLSAALDIRYAINSASPLFSVAREGGVTRAIVTPGNHDDTGWLKFGGQAAEVQTGTEGSPVTRSGVGVTLSLNDSDMGRAGLFVQFSEVLRDVRRYVKRPSDFDKGQLKAREWSRADLDALSPVVRREIPLAVAVDRASDIIAMLSVAREENIRIILMGAAEGWVVAADIAGAEVPVILNPTENLPSNFNRMAASLRNATILSEAGVRLAIIGSRSGHDARLLRYHAGLAVAHGLPYEKALEAVTVNPARIWGGNGFGQIAAGQEADLAIWSGDPFEPLTELKALYIKGNAQSLSNRQTLLRDKYTRALRNK